MIGIIDYGVGNIGAFAKIFTKNGVEYSLVNSAKGFQNVDKLILPGVGHFEYTMHQLESSHLLDELQTQVTALNKPILGVCVGMQLFADGSDEGDSMGLGWIPGRVRSMKSIAATVNIPVPHMGWNAVNFKKEAVDLRDGLEGGEEFYFLHSFYFDAADTKDVAATTNCGENFACVVKRDNVVGIQCHPEKSHNAGAKFLMNFVEKF